MKIFNLLGITSLTIAMAACSGSNNNSDAYGNFETTDVLVSSEMQGKLVKFTAEEGKTYPAGTQLGQIDTIQLDLKRAQLIAQRNLTNTKFQNITSQIQVQEEQKQTLLTDKKRVQNLLKDNAAPQKQLDDIDGKISVIESQIASIKTQNSAVFDEINMIDKQIAQINDQIRRCKIENPINGTVLEKYVEQDEIVTPGKTLYKVADLTNMILRVYVSGDQLSHIKLNQKVNVFIDKSKDETSELPGTITWVSPQAEFTPKIIQTKEERVNLVYAVKISVPNKGELKIGMPAEVKF